MQLFAVPYQLSLFPAVTRADAGQSNPPVGESERDRRSGSQWLKSIHAYLEFRAGESWRRLESPAQRNSPDRWEYLEAIRFLNDLTSGLEYRPVRRRA